MPVLDRNPAKLDAPAEPQQGVIDDARRRQRLRRRKWAALAIGAGLIAGAAWVSNGVATRSHTALRGQDSAGASPSASRQGHQFNVRLVPWLESVGTAGWCEVIEEHGATGGSACGAVPTPSQPFLQIQGSSQGGCPPLRPRGCRPPKLETQVAVTNPQITAILVDGGQRVATEPLPGLPYGLRGARVVTRVGAKLQALDALGRVVPETVSYRLPRQTTVRRWLYPAQPPRAACQLHVSALPGLSVRGGLVAMRIRRFPGEIVGRAFLPCASTEYSLQGVPLKVIVAVDAAQPSVRAADLPSFHAVRGQSGVFAGGSLTAMRSGNAWIVAEQGRDTRQRILVLRHLNATVRPGL